MAKIEQTPTELTIVFRPWFLWIMEALFILMTLAQFFIIQGSPFNIVMESKTNTFSCQRVQKTEGTCQLVTRFFFLSDIKRIPLESLQGAKYDKFLDSNGKPQQRVVLVTDRGEVAFPVIPTNRPQWQTSELNAIASDINTFIKDTRRLSLNVQQGNSRIGWIVGAFLVINLLVLVFCSEIVTCHFDKNRGYFTKKRSWVIITKKIEKPLLEIVDVLMEEKISKGRNYRVSLILASGKRLPLTAYYTNYYASQKKTREIADRIVSFLNLTTSDRPEYR